MKTSSVVVALLILLAGTGFGFQQWQSQSRQLAAYEQHVQNLLNDVEALSRQRLDADARATQLTQELAALRRQVDTDGSVNTTASPSSSVDIAQIEQRIRRELQREAQTQRTTSTNTSTASLVRQLAQLSPQEIGELMTLQGRYGPFLQALNVDDARMETIINGLSNLIAEQNNARMELLMDMQQQSTSPQDFREQEFQEKMRALDDPAAQAAAMAFILTEEEQALFQAMQPEVASGPFGARVFGGRAGNRAAFIASPDGIMTQSSLPIAVPGSNTDSFSFQIITGEPVVIDSPPN